MKNSIITCLILGMAVTITGCNKNDGFRVWEGRVLEYGTHKPVGNARVILFKGKSENFGPASFTAVDTVVTTSDGAFSFKYLNEPYAFKIRATAEEYYLNEVSVGNNFPHLQKDIELDPFAWLRLHIKNVNPVDENDFLSFGLTTIHCKGGFYGSTIDTIKICDKYRGNKNHTIRYAVYRQNTSKIDGSVNFTLGAHDTTNISIHY